MLCTWSIRRNSKDMQCAGIHLVQWYVAVYRNNTASMRSICCTLGEEVTNNVQDDEVLKYTSAHTGLRPHDRVTYLSHTPMLRAGPVGGYRSPFDVFRKSYLYLRVCVKHILYLNTYIALHAMLVVSSQYFGMRTSSNMFWKVLSIHKWAYLWT
jgi:hypothetical protein